MKRLALLALCLTMLVCGCSEKEEALDIVPVEAAEAIHQNVAFLDQLLPAEGEVLENYYPGIGELSDSAAAYISGTGAKAEEIAVLKANKIEEVEQLRKLAEKRVEDLKFRFEDYVPAEMEKLGSPVIIVKGDTVFLVICDEPESAEQQIEELTKAK